MTQHSNLCLIPQLKGKGFAWPCILDILGKTIPMTSQNFFNLAYLQYWETDLKLTCRLWDIVGIIIMNEVVVIAVPKPLLTDIALIVY